MGQYTLLRERFLDDNAPRVDSDHMISTPAKYTGKTWVYEITSKRGAYRLGEVKWYSGWRQYVFYPFEDTTFSLGCLMDIAKFIQLLIDEHHSSGGSADK